MHKLLTVGLLLGAFCHLSQSKCEDGWLSYKNEKCYKVYNLGMSFEEAKYLCENVHGGYLPSVTSIEIQTFLSFILFRVDILEDNVWLGAQRTIGNSSNFRWGDGSPFVYQNWAPGYPIIESIIDKCVAVQSPTKEDDIETIGKWKSARCDANYRVVCQKSPVSGYEDRITQLETKLDESQKRMEGDIKFIRDQMGGGQAGLSEQVSALKSVVDSELATINKEIVGLRWKVESGQNKINSDLRSMKLNVEGSLSTNARDFQTLGTKVEAIKSSIIGEFTTLTVEIDSSRSSTQREIEILKHKLEGDHQGLSKKFTLLQSDLSRDQGMMLEEIRKCTRQMNETHSTLDGDVKNIKELIGTGRNSVQKEIQHLKSRVELIKLEMGHLRPYVGL